MSIGSGEPLHSDGQWMVWMATANSRKWLPLRGLALLLVLCGAFQFSRIQAQKSHPPPARAYDIRPPVPIPIAELGYRPPGELPAFSYYSLVNLQFIDANHLLFVFNTTGLLHRDSDCSKTDSERLMRAVVLEIPSGRVEKQAEWELYDFSEFLWPLPEGRFALRRCSQLEQVDASLIPRPFINLEGTLEEVLFSPDRSVVLVEEKPEPHLPKPQPTKSGSRSLVPPSPTPPVAADTPAQMLNLDFIRINPLAVIAHSHAPLPVTIPILPQGFLQTLGAPHDRWMVTLQPFEGVQRQVAVIHSICAPQLTAITNSVFLVSMCPNSNQIGYQAYSIQGTLVWQRMEPPNRYSPRFLLAQNGAHFAIETLHATRPLAALDPLNNESIDAQIIDIYDTMTGTLIASVPVSPIYTGGRNADFSPDGTRLAVLEDGAIEIYDLNTLEKVQRRFPR